MRTISRNVYTFDELSPKAKETARQWYRSIDDMHWKDAVYEDATAIATILGITFKQRSYQTIGGDTKYEPCIWFSGFASQGDGACFEGTYSYAKGSCRKIREYAPTDETLHRIADGLYEVQRHRKFGVAATVTQSGRYYHSGCTTIDVSGNSRFSYAGHDGVREEDVRQIQSLLRSFMDWIYEQLWTENDYQNSDECVDDSITDNEYEFYENGSYCSRK